MNLSELYRNLLTDRYTLYYKDFTFNGNWLENATQFLSEYFRHAGKSPLAEFNCYLPDDNERDFRNKHMVSAYLLGCMIAENLFDGNQLKIDIPNCPFNYVWYLICLFHDAGYGFERNMQERDVLRASMLRNGLGKENKHTLRRRVIYDFKKRRQIQSSIWFGHYKFKLKCNRNLPLLVQDNARIREGDFDKEKMITQYYRKHRSVEFADGKKCNYPTYTSELINNYFEYRLADERTGCIDHGIAGGYVFFDTMIKNYIHCYYEANREWNCDFNDFYYNCKSYRIEQFSVFGYVADCIIAHNIWNGKNDEERYRKFGLNSLIGDNYKKVSKRNNPYLFILALSDTLEPLKIFRDSSENEEQLLRQIDFEFTGNSLIISSMDNEIYNAYRRKLDGVEDWIDIMINFIDEENEIRLIV